MSVIMVCAIILHVIMLNGIMLNVIREIVMALTIQVTQKPRLETVKVVQADFSTLS
jgi:hypothetical protein